MKIVFARVQSFRLPLSTPVAGGSREREGMILQLVDDDGIAGFGEASPASWAGGENLEVTRAALERVVAAVGRGIPGEALGALDAGPAADLEAARSDPSAARRGIEPLSARLGPAAASALECALLDLGARRAGEPLTVRLGGSVEPLEVSSLVVGETPDALVRSARDRAAAGFRCLKLKVGGRPVGADLERLAALREGAGPSPAIRLDANRGWAPAEALEALRGAVAFGIELVEEPLREASAAALATLRGGTEIAVALDESVRGEADLRHAIDGCALDALVLKAARVGGPRRALALARIAVDAGLRVIVTDSLETSVGGRLAVHLAAALPAPRAAIGLGGAACLLRDPDAPAGWGAGASVTPAGPGLEVVPAPAGVDVLA